MLNRQDARRYAGSMQQLGGTRHYELADGRSRGVRAIDFDTGAGLQFTVLPDRGMDISRCSFLGTNLVYLGPGGETHPAYYEPQGLGWLRGFFGGLLTTCGLAHVGGPADQDGEHFGLHGRHANTPASQVCDLSGWTDDSTYTMSVRGHIDDRVLFGRKLRMERTISTAIGAMSLLVEDVVENLGGEPSPLMILYHVNAGYPLLDEGTSLAVGARRCDPRDDGSRPHMDERLAFTAPVPGFTEQVFVYSELGDASGRATAGLFNPKLLGGVALWLRFDTATLPYMTQWRMLGESDYVVGIEPCNARCAPRAELLRSGELPHIEPGERRTFRVEIGIGHGPQALAALRSEIADQCA